MCGIIGTLGHADVAQDLLEGLKRLEYRGYDSAGIATLYNGSIERRRAEGKLINLGKVIEKEPLQGDIGIGHTRWATHGVPSERNAHPHATDRVAVVHNGIIENFRELRRELESYGCIFGTDTDTEVIVQLIHHNLSQGLKPVDATSAALERLEGAFALAILFAEEQELMIGARRGSPLCIGWGQKEMSLGSDALALAGLSNRISYLEDGDWAVITRDGATVRNTHGELVERAIRTTALSEKQMSKGNYPHFMAKEIHEQPTVIGQTLNTFFNPLDRSISLPELPFNLLEIERITLIACGTSFYAAMIAKYWFEQIARISVDIDIASEFRYRGTPMAKGGLALFISQSGETADTLAALRFCRKQGQHIAGIVNVSESTIDREADIVFNTHAGPEIGVASTKAFTCQLVTLACIVIATARVRGAISREQEQELSSAITEVPARAAEILNHDDSLRQLSNVLAGARDVLFIGRGASYPIALEGALKLKEISYIHAEGFAAGELKHGPIALIDQSVPVIVIAPSDALFEKTASNVSEVVARGAQVIFLSDSKGIAALGDQAKESIELPTVHSFVAPILYALPVQILAYHTAVLKGTDIDQPRNLAKSVTVE